MNQPYQLDDIPRAYAELPIAGYIRSLPEDFIVDEELSFSPTGEGEHVFLQVRKTGKNTEDIARILASHAGVTRKSVSYAGLKDRNAVTSQFFSVHLPGQQDPDWQQLVDSYFELISVNRHQKKLRRGAINRNSFRIRIRGFSGDNEIAEQRLQQITQQGVPNYFTAQRFGHNANNLLYADQMLQKGKRVNDRFKRNIYYSAARSWLFNLVVAERIRQQTWDKAIAGDSMMLSGSRSCFTVEAVDEETTRRVNEFDINPTAPLCGRGEPMVSAEAAEIEVATLDDWQGWIKGLEKARMDAARRAMRVGVPDLTWQWDGDDQLMLAFSLPPGSYATAVLRELGRFAVPKVSADSK
ncbi:MAG: tRNA pseudouridine(13) synthase TruD [Arenicellales bacterium]|jgi:tRNA pseudouridine13 synthase